jgi:hypothetical protein
MTRTVIAIRWVLLNWGVPRSKPWDCKQPKLVFEEDKNISHRMQFHAVSANSCNGEN